MISVEGLSVEFNATPLFEDVSYVINKKDRIALVGKNGAGKSTMLKILAGLQSQSFYTPHGMLQAGQGQLTNTRQRHTCVHAMPL